MASPYPQAYLQYSQVIQGMPHYPGQVTIVLVVLALILIHTYNSIGPETQNMCCGWKFCFNRSLTCIGLKKIYILFISLNVHISLFLLLSFFILSLSLAL